MQVLGHKISAQGLGSECLLARINKRRAKRRQRKTGEELDGLFNRKFGWKDKAEELVQLSKDRLKWRLMIVTSTTERKIQAARSTSRVKLLMG